MERAGIDFDMWKRSFVLMTVVFLLLTLSIQVESAYAGNNEWTSRGPYGGNIHALAINPTTPTTIFAGTYGGVYKSEDGGSSWICTGLSTTSVTALAIDRTAPSTIYAGTSYTGNEVYKSTNGGNSWSLINTGLSGTVNSLVIDQGTPSIIYAGTTNGVFKSINGGNSWGDLLYPIKVQALVIDPGKSTTIYAGTSSGVYKSTNGGTSWNQSSSTLSNSHISSLVIDSQTPATLYAGSQWIYKSTDGGESWVQIDVGPTLTYIMALAIDLNTPTTIYAVTFRGIYKSTNGGTSWDQKYSTTTDTYVTALAIMPSAPSTIYAGTGAFYGRPGCSIYKSTNGGTDWGEINNGLANTFVTALAIDKSAPATFYVGAYGGVYKSTNGGHGWSLIVVGSTNYIVYALAIDPSTPTTIYAGTDGGRVYKSTNSGNSWSQISAGLTGGVIDASVFALAIDPVTPTTIYASKYRSGIWKSENSGTSWSQINTGLTHTSVRSIVVDPSLPTTIYAGTDSGGVFKSTNGGINWSQINAGLTNVQVYSLLIDPSTPTTIFAGTDSGVCKSVNGGNTWTDTGLTTSSISSLAIHPIAPNTIFAGVRFSGVSVYKSMNGGSSWSPFNAGLKDSEVFKVVISPDATPTIYAGTVYGGIYSLDLKQTLTVGSSNPDSGVNVSMSPADFIGNSSGITNFTSTYSQGTTVTLTAPATAGGYYFTGWLGCDSVNSVQCTVTLTTDKSVTVSYGSLPAIPDGIFPIYGNSQVGISWTAAPGATSYNLYYSTTPGVTKATGNKIANVSSPKTVFSLINGKPYYFVVTSVNSAGESAESAEVSAIPTASAGAYSLADLTGVWFVNSLATGLGAPWWLRATASVAANGSFTISEVESDGNTNSSSGSLTISSSGVVSISNPDQTKCHMDSGKTVMACTSTWSSGVPNTSTMTIFTKNGTSYTNADLLGAWEVNGMASGSLAPVPWWQRASINVAAGGVVSGTTTYSDNTTKPMTGTLSIFVDGVVSYSANPNLRCTMDAGKTVMACTSSWYDGAPGTSGTTDLHLITKKAGSYAQTDLTGYWGVNILAAGPGAPYWARGFVSIDPAGVLSGSLLTNTGATAVQSGAMTMAVDGSITRSTNPNEKCRMDSDKSVISCTGVWTNGTNTTELRIFTRQSTAMVTLSGLAFTGGPPSVNEGSTATYTATAYWNDGTSTAVTPVWSISPATYATFDAAGKLTASAVPSDQNISVKAIYTFGGITLAASMPVTIINTSSNLTMTLGGSGTGSVNGVRGTDSVIACSFPPQSGLCAAFLPAGSTVNLSATLGGVSTFGGWGTQCGTCTGFSCVLNLDTDKNCTATFSLAPKAKIGASSYSSFHDAYVASSAPGMTTILLLADVLPISDTISKQLTLKGGYDTGFTSQTGFTTLQGAFTIGTGSAVVDRVVIK